MYQVCPHHPDIVSRFSLEFHFRNWDRFGNERYLSIGEMNLPFVFFFFSVSYLLCFFVWFTNIREINKGNPGHFAEPGERPVVYAIHRLMSLLLLLKFFSMLFESFRYYTINVTGHAELWTFVYLAVNFVKGTFLFCVILLIGTGWSFVKPFLNDREKKTIIVILILQFVNNIAIVFLSQETEGETSYARWAGILHLVDIACCCAVLIPIVWQVNELEKSMGLEDDADLSEREAVLEDGEKSGMLSKLRLFRTFYLLVVGYIYATRILVYLFSTLLDYRHLWVHHFVIEVVTLSFYVAVGFMFRPASEVSYQSVSKNDDHANGNGIELQQSKGDKTK
jgi:G protein-coupled receptor 107